MAIIAITALVVLLGLVGASDASESLREQAVALERACKGVEAVKIYRRAARGGDGKAAKRLVEIYRQGIDGVLRDYAESLNWEAAALRLGEHVPTSRLHSAGSPPPCKPQPRAQHGPAPGTFEFRMTFMPRGGFDAVEFRDNGLNFESHRIVATRSPAGTRYELRPVESVGVRPSVEQWRKFRESLDRAKIWEWQPRYDAPIPDGTGWSLNIEYADRHLKTEGHNSYPSNFEMLQEAVNALLGGRKFR